MAERTAKYSDLQSNVQHLIGTDTLLTTEINAINSFFRAWVRKGWNRANWPDICRVEQRTPVSDVVEYEQTAQEANKFPYEVPYLLNHQGAVLLNTTSLTSVYVLYRQRIPDYSAYDGSSDSQTFPYRFFNYCVYGCYSDWLASEGQHEKSRMVKGQAEEAMQDELDILERQQRQQTATIFSTHNSAQQR